MRREDLRRPGSRISSVVPFFPLNPFVSAARLTRPAAAPSAFRVAVPNFSESLQKTTKVPRGAVENGTKPTLTASDIREFLQNKGCGRQGPGWPALEMFPSAPDLVRREHGQGTMACHWLCCQARAVARGPHRTN